MVGDLHSIPVLCWSRLCRYSTQMEQHHMWVDVGLIGEAIRQLLTEVLRNMHLRYIQLSCL
jgi:hypothetical protein